MSIDQTELFNSEIGTPYERVFAGLTPSPIPSSLVFQPMVPPPPIESVQRHDLNSWRARSCSVASSPHPLIRTSSLPVQATSFGKTVKHFCEWVKDDGTLCAAHITRETISKHLIVHGIKLMPKNMPVRCRWFRCRIKGNKETMNRESIVRHVRETHLGYFRWQENVPKHHANQTTGGHLPAQYGCRVFIFSRFLT